MLGVPRQYKSVAIMLGYKLDFNCCANKDGFHRDSYIYSYHTYNFKMLVCDMHVLLESLTA